MEAAAPRPPTTLQQDHCGTTSSSYDQDEDGEEPCLLQADFLAYSRKPQPVRAALRCDGLHLRYTCSGGQVKEKQVPLAHLVGCHVMRSKLRRTMAAGDSSQEEEDPPPEAYLCFYCYPLRKRKFVSSLKRTREPLVLKVESGRCFQDNLAAALQWRRATTALLRAAVTIRPQDSIPISYMNMSSGSDKKFLVLVNPKSGPGKAMQIFQARVYPVLAEAEVDFKLFVTSKRFDAQEMVRCEDLSRWKGIIIVSGDGLLFEVFNGLMERSDWPIAIKTPVGVIPGGSGNGLARTIAYSIQEPYEENPILISTLNVVKGCPTPMDLVNVETSTKKMYSFLSVGWGLMADIDIESERLRALGEPRFTLWALARVIKLRVYQGRVSYLPISDVEGQLTPSGHPLHNEPSLHRSQTVSFSTNCNHNNNNNNINDNEANGVVGRSISYQQKALSASVESGVGGNVDGLLEGDLLEEFQGGEEGRGWTGSVEVLDDGMERGMGINGESGWMSHLPPLEQQLPEGWIVEEGSYVMVYAAYQSHLGTDVFFAPSAKLADGIIWLLLLRAGVSRSQVAQFLLGTSTGEHVNCPYVQMVPVKAFRLEPFGTNGYLTVDGELVDYGPLQAEVIPALARVIVRGKGIEE